MFYIYDDKMLLHEDHYGKNPERPLRIKSIYDYLDEIGLLTQMKQLDIIESAYDVLSDGTCSYPAIETIHDPEDIKLILKNMKN